MAALLKDVYTVDYMEHVAKRVNAHYAEFNEIAFIDAIFDQDWQGKELKARTTHIAIQLNTYIQLDYSETLHIIQKIAPHFTGYQGMFIPAFVALYGVEDFSESVQALSYITQFASAEFAIRSFIERYPEAMHKELLAWTHHDNEHIRRLASEGARPRLPWAMALPAFKKNPDYLLPILENLKTDSSEYVRRSVANNLNDIAKDHPLIVTNIAARWLSEDSTIQTKRLVKHACRSLLKQANPAALALFGFLTPKEIQVIEFSSNTLVQRGDTYYFSFKLQHKQHLPLSKLRVEFAIDFMKKNGQQTRKIFQLSESVISQAMKSFNKSFSFKPISTRTYYCGQHSIAILVNGEQLHIEDFILAN